VRLDLAPVGGLHGYLSFGHVRAIYVPPNTGGLFLTDNYLANITGGPFVIDHDESLEIQSGLNYDFGNSGIWAGTTARYDSGLVTGADRTIVNDPDNAFAYPYINFTSNTNLDPNRIKPRTLWNFSGGIDMARYGIPVNAQVDLLNAFDKKGVYNVLSTFGGTHVIPPRTLAARLKYSF
jgi:hypothetical protein